MLTIGSGLAGLQAAHAEDQTFDTPSGLQVPRWAMLRRNEVYARNGPSKDNRIIWTYRTASLPVQIISETRDWRLICDPDGGVAWVSKTMIQSQKTVMSPAGQKLQMRYSPDEKADIKAILKPKALASLDKCRKGWCRISAAGQTGWVPQPSLWGTQTTAACKRPDPFAAR
ncbi:SH3 domain-containing protein [Asticcacaulis sp.]|uniref:SH3 domain-containing protein n=1 Tax=Asticcacaulis sp. TaxID=1872648 RepID=UPI0039E45A37